MSSSFIGSKIAIVTKSQCRYSGTIIGIDAQASSIILGNVKCFGTENRNGSLSNGHLVGTVVPIMQFANSDIEDLKIVDEENSGGSTSTSSAQSSVPTTTSAKQPSIHDDPAIVSAVVSSGVKKETSITSRLVDDLQHLTLSHGQNSKLGESRVRNDSGELGASWSLLSPSKWTSQSHPGPVGPSTGNKSKFFDDFKLNNSNGDTSSSSTQRWPSNNHGTQTSQRQPFQQERDNDRGLPIRQPFFTDDQSALSGPMRSQNGHHHQQLQPQQQQQQQQRNFYNHRRPQNQHQYQHQHQYQQRRPGGGNRETFDDNGSFYENDFDFESSNRKFNKLASEDEFKQQSSEPQLIEEDLSSADYKPLYDKKKSFFDNITLQETSDLPVPIYHRSRNQDTFGGNDRYQRSKQQHRPQNNNYRRTNHTNYRQQSNNDDFHSRSHQNGYHYRY